MNHICELEAILEKYFNWNKSRLAVMVNLLIGLILIRTVNLSEHAVNLPSKAKIESNYKRIQRFFKWLMYQVSYQEIIIKLIINILNLKDRKNDLNLDRTDWKFGKKHINLLVLGVNFKGISVPLAWFSLGRAGNSKTIDCITLLEKVINEIPIKSFTADREFIGEEWFKFLVHSNIPFFIRIKEDTQILKNNYTIALRDLFKNLKNGKRKYLKEKYTLLKIDVQIAASRNHSGELLIVITNVDSFKALKMYKRRWAIETLFGYLKTKGFNFEDTHMTHSKKIEGWMLILTLAVVWTLKIDQVIQTKLTINTQGRNRKSIFKSCFEVLRKCLLNSNMFINELCIFLKLLKNQKTSLHII